MAKQNFDMQMTPKQQELYDRTFKLAQEMYDGMFSDTLRDKMASSVARRRVLEEIEKEIDTV